MINIDKKVKKINSEIERCLLISNDFNEIERLYKKRFKLNGESFAEKDYVLFKKFILRIDFLKDINSTCELKTKQRVESILIKYTDLNTLPIDKITSPSIIDEVATIISYLNLKFNSASTDKEFFENCGINLFNHIKQNQDIGAYLTMFLMGPTNGLNNIILKKPLDDCNYLPKQSNVLSPFFQVSPIFFYITNVFNPNEPDTFDESFDVVVNFLKINEINYNLRNSYGEDFFDFIQHQKALPEKHAKDEHMNLFFNKVKKFCEMQVLNQESLTEFNL